MVAVEIRTKENGYLEEKSAETGSSSLLKLFATSWVKTINIQKVLRVVQPFPWEPVCPGVCRRKRERDSALKSSDCIRKRERCECLLDRVSVCQRGMNRIIEMK